LANVETHDVRCVKYVQRPTLIGGLVSAASPAPVRGQLDVDAFFDELTPRAYYLWTWLPAIMSNSR
jgi:hypothetical protein